MFLGVRRLIFGIPFIVMAWITVFLLVLLIILAVIAKFLADLCSAPYTIRLDVTNR